MNAFIKSNKNEIILENTYTKITFSKKDAVVLSALRLDTNESYLSNEVSNFFTFYNLNDEIIPFKEIDLDGDVIKVTSDFGSVRFKVSAFDRYFTFEVLDDISEPIEKIEFSNILCDYEVEGEKAWGVVGLSMSVNTNPVYIPRAKERKVKAQAERTTGNTKGAKYALVSAPLALHRDILKEASETIDREKGIVLRSCGAWAKEYMPNYQNYSIMIGTKKEFVENADYYKNIGVEQYDFHQGTYSFIQGNFKCANLPSMKDFKEQFSDVLAEKGIMTSIHTYVHYIHPSCHEYLADPKWQKDLCILNEYTLAEDISAEDTTILPEESIADLSTDHTFFSKSLPYLMIGNEIVSFAKRDNKFIPCGRGVCGTKAVAHKKGEKIKHIEGYFNLFAPIPGSPLFLEIAHNTAKAYNEGGFGMIYLDAMDGMGQHTKKKWYYDALFTHEIVKNCKTDPIVEYADHPASVWAARGRGGAWDHPWNAYRYFNKLHVYYNRKDLDDAHLIGMMGWYNHYPQDQSLPGNLQCKYHHWDMSEHLGSLCLINGYSMVFHGGFPNPRYPASIRNVNRYLVYQDLLKRKYFSDEYLEKLKDTNKEYHLKNKGKDKWIFEEKKFELKHYFNYQDENQNKNEFVNPFSKQTPFLRLEMGLSTLGNNEMVILPIDETKQLPEKIDHSFGGPLDLTANYALKVRIHGNGKKGSAVRIALISRSIESGYTSTYMIETDFEGFRDYVFVESHKGERDDLPFDERYGHFYKICINSARLSHINHIRIDTAGDIEGVRMSSVVGCKPIYDVVKNPKVKIGNTDVTFECEIKSTDFIEWDGKKAEVIDRYGNARPIYFSGDLKAPKGKFKAELTSSGSLNGAVQNAKLTFGFTGKEIK